MMNSINKDKRETLIDKWYFNASVLADKEAVVHWVTGEEPYRWTYKELLNCAEKFAVILKDRGIKKNQVCATIIRHNKYFYPLYLAVSLLGALPAVLAYPNSRLHPEKFRQGLEGMSRRSGLDFILTERSLEPVVKPLVEKENSTIKKILFPLDWNIDREFNSEKLNEVRTGAEKIYPNDNVILQHSSGTTGLQKPVILSHKTVLDHINNYSRSIALTRNDKIISWLPLYHDMGLIAAFHLPLAMGITTVQLDTFEWVLVPSLLPEAVSCEKGTLTWLPNFAYNMLADKISDEELEGISLESLRMVINCSEPVRYESHQKFYKRFSSYGIKKQALATCYAMTETTFAVTQSKPNKKPKVLWLNSRELANGSVVVSNGAGSVRICVSSGSTIKGCKIKVVDEKRNSLPESCVGELAISSETLFDGYRNYSEKNAEVLKDGWYYTGDYGFRYGSEYFVIGRKNDIIIVGGNNLYPEDIEDVISETKGVIPGRVIAFGEYDEQIGSEQVSVIAETKITDAQSLKNLKLEVIKACMSIDVTVKNVYFVPPRWLIKSSAGKPARKANKERILTANIKNPVVLNNFEYFFQS